MDSIIEHLDGLILGVCGFLSALVMEHLRRRPVPLTPHELEDRHVIRLQGIVDHLQEELERRDREAASMIDELRQMRHEMDALHRIVSACYRILTENGLEPPPYPSAQ